MRVSRLRIGGVLWPERCFLTKLTMLEFTSIKKRTASCLWATCLSALLCLLTEGAPVMAASSSEEALRARVEQCYTALQQGNWQKVEKYLTKDSKPLFRDQAKKPLAAYQIQSIKIEPDGRTATVVVQVPIISAMTPKPLLVPKTSLWRMVNHAWYMELPKPDPSAQRSLFETAPKTARSTPGPLYSRDLKFEALWRSLGVVEGNGTQVVRFPFKNVSTHVVTLTDVQLGCDCLRLKTPQMEYKPGESGVLEIEFDPSKLSVNSDQSFMQDILFKTEPGGAYVKLTIAALVTTSPAPPAKP